MIQIKHYHKWEKLISIYFKIRNKVNIPSVTTLIQHYTGDTSQHIRQETTK